ncbi:replication endonuclease [Orbus wheelerorum]|uniref:replication endonuclease n=1 Tax=Orbus wheelerorum TaxID=3074111 RepID=UPI00370DD779
MSTITQQLRELTNSIPAKDRFLSGLATRDYYENIGQYQQPQKIAQSFNVRPEFGRELISYRPEPKDMNDQESKLWQVNRADFDWYRQYFCDLPDYLGGYFANKYITLFKSKGRKAANTFVRETLGGNIQKRLDLVNAIYETKPSLLAIHFNKEFNELPNYSRERIADLAYRISIYVNDLVCYDIKNRDFTLSGNIINNDDLDNVKKRKFVFSDDPAMNTHAHKGYYIIFKELKGLNILPPYFANYKQGKLSEREALIALAKVSDNQWWYNQLKRRRDHQKEHLAIAAGQVQNKASAYASRSCISEWTQQKQSNREWANNQLIQNEEGEQFELTLQIDKSNANPAIRRCELMVRMRGFEDLADEHGYIGAFITLTAPSKYHSCHSKGGFVQNWIGNNPRDTQKYLCSVWAKIRAKLNRDDIHLFGFRVAEPHHDGTPHWHILVFMQPKHRDAVERIMRAYALEVDGDEPGASENRFKFVDIEKEKGSATGYIAKYISKNIDGYALNGELDDETGQDLKTMSKAVTAWASRWRIRQFQQIGGAPVTVYRELRRLKDKKVQDENVDPILAAADVGCWATYTELQGGAMVKRKDLKVRISYEEKLNQFEEPQQKIKGVFSPITGLASFICTRLIKWKIVKKGKQSKGLDLKKRAERTAWSSVNNCTPSFDPVADDQKKRIKKGSKLDEILDDLERKEIDFNRWLENPAIRQQQRPTKEGKNKQIYRKNVQILEDWIKNTPKVAILPDIDWSF